MIRYVKPVTGAHRAVRESLPLPGQQQVNWLGYVPRGQLSREHGDMQWGKVSAWVGNLENQPQRYYRQTRSLKNVLEMLRCPIPAGKAGAPLPASPVHPYGRYRY